MPILNAVSYVISVPLVIHNESLERISEYYRNTGVKCLNSRQQAMCLRSVMCFPTTMALLPDALLRDMDIFNAA